MLDVAHVDRRHDRQPVPHPCLSRVPLHVHGKMPQSARPVSGRNWDRVSAELERARALYEAVQVPCAQIMSVAGLGARSQVLMTCLKSSYSKNTPRSS